MPSISVVPVDLAVNTLIKYIKYFNSDKLPEHSSRVWRDISRDLKGLWKVPAVRINVQQDRRKILTLAREKCGIIIEKKENIPSHFNGSTTSSDNSNTTNDLSVNDSGNDQENCELVSPVNDNEDDYGVMCGQSKDHSFDNSVFANIKEPPLDDGSVVIMKDTCYSKHANVKHPLKSKKSKEVRQKRSSVLGWRKAKISIKPGDTGSPFLYNLGTLHQAKKEATYKKLGINSDDRSDMILAIRKMNEDPLYVNCISWISDTPFFVFYATPTQFNTYAEYLQIHNQNSSICVDATGGLVKKLPDSGDKKTGHIFLYQIVINFDHTTIPVYQMLSEKHSDSLISFWLSEWAEKVNLPQQAVSDGSGALLNAMSIAFNGKSLKEYINYMFESITTNVNVQARTFIRLDPAHFLQAVSRWTCFQSGQHKILKPFYINCISLMIDCEELSKLEEIFMMTSIVCNTEFEDSIIALGHQIISSSEARTYLEKLFSERNLDLTIMDSAQVDSDKTVIFEELSSQATDDRGWSVALVTWIENLCKKVNTTIFMGEKINTHYVPGLYTDLVNKMKDFILWTNVCTPKTMSQPTSCYVEADFKDLKRNLNKKVKLPTTVNKFLKLHITDILDGVNVFRSKLKKFVDENYSYKYQKKSKEEIEYENGKVLGKNLTAIDCDWTLDCGNVWNMAEHDANYLSMQSENLLDLVIDTNLAKKKEDGNNSVTTFDNTHDHNYNSIDIQETFEDSIMLGIDT